MHNIHAAAAYYWKEVVIYLATNTVSELVIDRHPVQIQANKYASGGIEYQTLSRPCVSVCKYMAHASLDSFNWIIVRFLNWKSQHLLFTFVSGKREKITLCFLSQSEPEKEDSEHVYGLVCICLALKLYLSWGIAFFWSYSTVYGPSNLTKCRFLCKFKSYGIIYTFKNYFAIIFLTINF